MPTISEVYGVSDPTKVCARCGHPEGDHLMHADQPYPTDGWVTCPVAGCDCYGTWSVNQESRASLEHYRAEYLREQAARTEEPPAA